MNLTGACFSISHGRIGLNMIIFIIYNVIRQTFSCKCILTYFLDPNINICRVMCNKMWLSLQLSFLFLNSKNEVCWIEFSFYSDYWIKLIRVWPDTYILIYEHRGVDFVLFYRTYLFYKIKLNSTLHNINRYESNIIFHYIFIELMKNIQFFFISTIFDFYGIFNFNHCIISVIKVIEFLL